MKGPVFAGFCAVGPTRGRRAVLSARRRGDHAGPPGGPVSGQIVLSEAESGERARAAGLLNSASGVVGLQRRAPRQHQSSWAR